MKLTKTFLDSLMLLVMIVANLFIVFIGDNTPPSMKEVCGPDINKTADKYQTTTIVFWRENNAIDDQDGEIR